jgi:hypothetical protein
MRTIWNDENLNTLREMYNDYKSDDEIATILGTTTYAVARQRSVIGLVKFHRKVERCRRNVIVEDPFVTRQEVAYYTKDGQDHFIVITGLEHKEKLIRRVMDKQGIRHVVILKPTSVLSRGTTQHKDIIK